MRFLVDEALQDLVADRLIEAGHDATHVRAIGMQGATDDDVLAQAASQQRVLITTDTDFGTILALTGAAGPSVLLLRGVGDTVNERVDPPRAASDRGRSDQWNRRRGRDRPRPTPSTADRRRLNERPLHNAGRRSAGDVVREREVGGLRL